MSGFIWQLWSVVGVLSLGILAIMLSPLIVRRDEAQPTREDFDINVYKDQLGEVDRDLERGLLNEDQAKAARVEIKRRMLAADKARAGKHAAGPTGDRRSSTILVVAVSVLLPIGAVAMYLNLGQPGQPDRPLAGRALQNEQADGGGKAELKKMVGQLIEMLKTRPEDPRGWALLGNSYVRMEKYNDAIGAYEKAYELSDRNPEIAVNYGEAMALAADAVVTPEAEKIFRSVADTDPSNPKAVYYLSIAEAQRGNLKSAIQGWVDLIEMSPPNAAWLPVVGQQIRRAADEAGIDAKTIRPTAQAMAVGQQLRAQTKAAGTMPAAPGPSQSDMDAAAQMSGAEQQNMIRAMVERLATRLKDNPGDKAGWIRLERAYRVLGESAKADEAAANAAKLP